MASAAMLANITVLGWRRKCAGAVQMFITACKMLITATTVNNFHKPKTVQQDEYRSKMTEMATFVPKISCCGGIR